MTAKSAFRLRLAHAESDAETAACFPAMRALRTHLKDEAEFVARVRRQREAGYRLLALWEGPRAVACAGYRIAENLVRGPFVYVDDLVTLESERSKGLGKRLLDAVNDEARRLGLRHIVLDSGVANARGHRFYFREGFIVRGFHFAHALED
jgi:GNAT superfamily N-acetyltransferase